MGPAANGCVSYAFTFAQQTEYPSLATAQFCALISPILAGIGIFANLVDLCVCNFVGSYMIGSLIFLAASGISAGTFTLLADPVFWWVIGNRHPNERYWCWRIFTCYDNIIDDLDWKRILTYIPCLIIPPPSIFVSKVSNIQSYSVRLDMVYITVLDQRFSTLLAVCFSFVPPKQILSVTTLVSGGNLREKNQNPKLLKSQY